MPKSEFDPRALVTAEAIRGHLRALGSERALPAASVAACVVGVEHARPALLSALDRAAANLPPPDSDDDRFLFRAIHILGGARVEDAFPPLMRLLARPADDVVDLFGDAITETLARIVAGVFDGDAETLFAAIEDRESDEFVRDALLGAATFLCWNRRIERDAMERFLERFFDETRASPGEQVWLGWTDSVGLLGLTDLAERARSAFRDGRVAEDVADASDFERLLRGAPHRIESFEDNHLGYLEDVVEALELFDESDDDGDWREPGVPATNPFRDVGRNDPCPCGSGLKAKKCCLK